MKILIDNGHGENTKGKRSPDGLLREYSYTRDIAAAVERELRTRGYDVERIVRESIDVSLSERARRVNEWCGRLGASKVLLVSIHVNAAGSGEEWMSARGWSAYTHKGKSKSDRLANALYAAAEKNFRFFNNSYIFNFQACNHKRNSLFLFTYILQQFFQSFV